MLTLWLIEKPESWVNTVHNSIQMSLCFELSYEFYSPSGCKALRLFYQSDYNKVTECGRLSTGSHLLRLSAKIF